MIKKVESKNPLKNNDIIGQVTRHVNFFLKLAPTFKNKLLNCKNCENEKVELFDAPLESQTTTVTYGSFIVH